jgi:hypothetical protein
MAILGLGQKTKNKIKKNTKNKIRSFLLVIKLIVVAAIACNCSYHSKHFKPIKEVS